MKKISLEKVVREFDEMIYVRTCWFNEAINIDQHSSLANLMSILDFVTLRCNITGESYDELIVKYYNPLKEEYENTWIK